jgi:hypothetical protein
MYSHRPAQALNYFKRPPTLVLQAERAELLATVDGTNKDIVRPRT